MQKTTTIESILETNKSLNEFMNRNNIIVATQADELTFYLESKNKTQDPDPVVKISVNLKFLCDGMLIKKFFHPDWNCLYTKKRYRTVFEKQIKPVSTTIAISVLSLYLSILEEAPASEQEKMDWEQQGVMRFFCRLHPTNVAGIKEKCSWECQEEFRKLADFCYFWLIKYDCLKEIELEFYPKFKFGQGIYSGMRMHSSRDLNELGLKNNDTKIDIFFLHDALYINK